MPRRSYVLALAAMLSVGAPPVRAQVADTIANKTPLFTRKDVGITAAFVAGTVVIAPVDHYFAHRLQDSSIQSNRWLHGAAKGLRIMGWPGSFVAGSGLYLIGKASHNRRTATVGLHSVEAILLGDLVGGGAKAFFGRARPYVDINNSHNFQIWRGFQSDDYRSFPSGHTINAFAFASTVSRETEIFAPHSRWFVGTAMYGAATLVGVSRMYNNDHWASDIVAGAGIGTLIGLKVVKYQHSHPGNRIDNALLSVSITPQSNGSKAHLSFGF